MHCRPRLARVYSNCAERVSSVCLAEQMTALLKERIEKLEHDLENTRTRLAKKCTQVPLQRVVLRIVFRIRRDPDTRMLSSQYEEVLLMANEIALAYERRLNHSTRDQAVQTEAGKWREYRSRHAARESGRNAVEITETQQGDIGGSMSSLHPHAEKLPAQVADQDQDCGDHHARPLLSRDHSYPSSHDSTWSASALSAIDHGDTSLSGRLAGALEPVLSLLSPRGGADAPLQSHPSLLSQAQTSVMSLLSPRRQGT